MKKKIKWIIIGISVVIIAVLIYAGALVRYADREMGILNIYNASLEVLPEVDSVRFIHRFSGLESYVVALVELSNNQEAYFFVRDGVVQHYIEKSELITEAQAMSVALDLIVGGEIHDTQLGIIDDTPIFEVQIALNNDVYYVVINAVSGNVIMNFSL